MDALRRHGSALVFAAFVPVAVALALPGSAQAHLRSSAVAVDYRGQVTSATSALRAALTARILESDRALEVTVRSGHAVVVLGDLGEPMLRLDDAGLAVNVDSPSAAAAGLASGGTHAVGGIHWQLDPGRRSVVWHDARVQGRASGAWQIPLLVDGHLTRLRGTIRRLPAPSYWPWALAAALAVAGAAALAGGRRDDLKRRGTAALAAAAGGSTIATAAVFALGPYASAGTWIAGVDEAVFAAVGLAVLRCGGRQTQTFAAIGLGLLSLAVGASKGAVFLHPLVLSVVPSSLARLIVFVTVAAGAGACVLAAAFCLSGDGLRPRQPEHLRRRPPVGSSTAEPAAGSEMGQRRAVRTRWSSTTRR